MPLRAYSRGSGASVCPGGNFTHGLPYTPDEIVCCPFSQGAGVGIVSVLTSFADTVNAYVTFGAATSYGVVQAVCVHSQIK